jgi:hypothetical protein
LSGNTISLVSAKQKYSNSDRFEKRYLFGWAVCYLLIGLMNTVFDRQGSGYQVVALLLFALTVVVGTILLLLECSRRAASVFLALPILWAFDFALSAIGADVNQRSFWLTYPYYATRVEAAKAATFKWAQNDWYLGGGWQYKLLHEPGAESWKQFGSTSKDETQFISGTGNKFKAFKRISGECENQELRHLGGNWYMHKSVFGEGIGC